ncbi:MAG: hypothetical protein JST82_07900 [Bacteroidetes bacterium]|nr:hypothetical protein [Bacteroidota bacterium]
MNHVPLYLSILFIGCVLYSLYSLYIASHKSKTILLICLSWLLLQAIICFTGFYTITNTLPPRFLLLIAPPLLSIILLFSTAKGRQFINNLDAGSLIKLHIVRIPVEMVLLGLFIYKQVPQLMTFEGRNFDILSGISALFIWWLYKKGKLKKSVFLTWNIICMFLLINIVAIAAMSLPSPIQQLAFEQPNMGVLYFPFIWLPCFVVPLVLLSHITLIRRQLIK